MSFSFRRSFRRAFRRVSRAVTRGLYFDDIKDAFQDLTGITAQKEAAKAAQKAELAKQQALETEARNKKLAEQQAAEDAATQRELASTQAETSKTGYSSDFSGLLLGDEDEDEDDILTRMLKKN